MWTAENSEAGDITVPSLIYAPKPTLSTGKKIVGNEDLKNFNPNLKVMMNK